MDVLFPSLMSLSRFSFSNNPALTHNDVGNVVLFSLRNLLIYGKHVFAGKPQKLEIILILDAVKQKIIGGDL